MLEKAHFRAGNDQTWSQVKLGGKTNAWGVKMGLQTTGKGDAVRYSDGIKCNRGAKRVGRSEIVFRKSVVTRLLLPKWVQTRKRRERDTLNNNPFAVLVRFPFFFHRMTFCISYGSARTTRHLPSCLAPICLTYCDKAQFISKKARETNMEKDMSCGYKRGTL